MAIQLSILIGNLLLLVRFLSFYGSRALAASSLLEITRRGQFWTVQFAILMQDDLLKKFLACREMCTGLEFIRSVASLNKPWKFTNVMSTERPIGYSNKEFFDISFKESSWVFRFHNIDFFAINSINSQCGNFKIFASLRFYVKSILRIAEMQKLPVLPY